MGGGGAGDVVDVIFEEPVVAFPYEGEEGVCGAEEGEEVDYETCLEYQVELVIDRRVRKR